MVVARESSHGNVPLVELRDHASVASPSHGLNQQKERFGSSRSLFSKTDSIKSLTVEGGGRVPRRWSGLFRRKDSMNLAEATQKLHDDGPGQDGGGQGGESQTGTWLGWFAKNNASSSSFSESTKHLSDNRSKFRAGSLRRDEAFYKPHSSSQQFEGSSKKPLQRPGSLHKTKAVYQPPFVPPTLGANIEYDSPLRKSRKTRLTAENIDFLNDSHSIHSFSSIFPEHKRRFPPKMPLMPGLRKDENGHVASPRSILVGNRVRFLLTETGEFHSETLECSVQLTKREVRAMWWSRQEQKDMKQRANSAATRVLACTDDFRLAIEQLLLQCYEESGTAKFDKQCQIDATNETATDLHTASHVCANPQNKFSFEEALRILVHHGARGKEQSIINAYKLESCRFYYKCDNVRVSKILQAQTFLKQNSVESNADCIATMIASEHRHLSVFAAQFARILAAGDACAANGDYDESSASTSSTCSFDEDDMSAAFSRYSSGSDFYTL